MPRRSHTLSVTLPNYGALVLSRICGKLEGAVSVLDVEQENRGGPNTGVILLSGILKMDEVDSIAVLLKVAYGVDEMFALKTEARYMADMSSNSGVARHHGFYAVYEGYPFGCSILDYHTNVLGSSLSSMGDEHFRWVKP
ncbi:hypothetical protein H0H93_015520 [Arthromyces matolae]|nr:hypothetical protein H0H93_015520 [Arthromyces matolae]